MHVGQEACLIPLHSLVPGFGSRVGSCGLVFLPFCTMVAKVGGASLGRTWQTKGNPNSWEQKSWENHGKS